MTPSGQVATTGPDLPTGADPDAESAPILTGFTPDGDVRRVQRSPLDRLATSPGPVLFLLSALSYWGLGYIGIALSYPPGVAAPLWPPAGIAVLFMAIVAKRPSLAWVSAGVFVGEVAADLSHAVPLLPTLGYAAGTLAYVPAAALIRRWGLYDRGLVNGVGDVVTFTALATFAGAANGVVALLVATAEGHASVDFFLTWSTGNVLGILLFVPLAVTWLGQRHPISDGSTALRALPWLLMYLAVVIVAVVLLFGSLNPYSPFGLLAPYVISALILLGAWHLGPPAAALLLTVAACGTALQTAAGHGPFAEFSPDVTVALYTSQLAFVVLIVTILLMAAARVQLSAATHRYRALFQDAPAMYVVARPDDASNLVLLDCNTRFTDAVGYPRPDVVGRPLGQFVSARHDETVTAETDPADDGPPDAEAGLLPGQQECELVKRDGTTIPVLMQAEPVVDASGDSRIRAMLVDLTDRRRAETLEQENQLIRQQQLALLRTLLAGIAHEVKNPLNFVVNFAEIAQELATDAVDLLNANSAGAEGNPDELQAILDDIRTNADTISKHGKRALDVMMGMLSLSQPIPPEPTVTDINGLVEQYSELAFHGIRGRGIDVPTPIRYEFDPDTPEIPVIAPDIGRVILNIVGNACDAIVAARNRHNKSTVEVTVSTRHTPHWVEIEVRDTGLGIAPEVRTRIFEPFFTTKPAGEGTGLGLAICHDIVTKHRGEIAVDSVEGAYTALCVRLPSGRART